MCVHGSRHPFTLMQDERFSYVILRRGPRPSFRVAVSRDVDSVDSSEKGNPSAARPQVLPQLPVRVVLSQIFLNRRAEAATSPHASTGLDTTSTVGAVPERGTSETSKLPNAASHRDGVDTRPTGCRTLLFGDRHSSASIPASTSYSPREQRTVEVTEVVEATPGEQDLTPLIGHSPANSNVSDRGRGGGDFTSAAVVPDVEAGRSAERHLSPVIAAFARKYPAFGPGLVGRLAGLQVRPGRQGQRGEGL